MFLQKYIKYILIPLGIAKNTHQLPSYTKRKGLDKEKLRQMILQYLKNAGDEGQKGIASMNILRMCCLRVKATNSNYVC